MVSCFKTDMTLGASIVIATYNGANYLDDQMRSILAQISSHDEVIVMDDHSSDDTRAIVAHYGREHANIKLLANERNIGVRATFERLLSVATKDTLILSDQDDIWIDGRRDRMIEALRHQGCVAVLANARILTEDGAERTFFPEARSPNVDSIAQNYFRNNFIGCCMAIRREVLELALPFPATISMHDWWLGSCAIALGRVRYLAEPSLFYRRHTNNQSAGKRRSWRIVIKDRMGNLRALVVLWRRVLHRRLTGRRLRNALSVGGDV
ncbi:MAG: glycosyltransferase [Cytophagaceae bacterium]|nr:MAG: glycosyltransferase [Cytophagaceae bacterium]